MPAPLAPTPQLGNKSPPVSCDPSEFPPLALVPSPPGGLSAPLLGQVGLRTKAKRSVSRAGVRREERLRGEPARRGAGPGGVLGTSPGDLAQAESRSETARAPSARGAGKRGRRGSGAARRDEARRSDERPGSEDRQTKPEADAAPGALRPGQASVAATASFPEKVAS